MLSRIVRTACLSAAAAVAVYAVPAASNAAVLAQWTFENTFASITGTAASGPAVAPETGTGSFAGAHVSASSVWSSPAGAGSAHSYSGNNWGTTSAADNYYQFSTSTAGYEDISVSFNAMGSGTGPKNFTILYSTDGSAFTSVADYSLINVAWSSSSNPDPTNSTFSFDMSAIGALDNATTVYFRLQQKDTGSIGGATVGTGGTSRVDNVTISGTAVPEPASLGLVTGAGLLLAGRRRRA